MKEGINLLWIVFLFRCCLRCVCMCVYMCSRTLHGNYENVALFKGIVFCFALFCFLAREFRSERKEHTTLQGKEMMSIH